MTLNERIIAVVTPIVPVCVPDLLVTEAGETPPEEYCTFDYTQTAGLAGDDGTDVGLARVQLHYLAPLKASTVAKRRALVMRGGEPDFEKASAVLLQDYRDGKLGRISLETPETRAAMIAASVERPAPETAD